MTENLASRAPMQSHYPSSENFRARCRMSQPILGPERLFDRSMSPSFRADECRAVRVLALPAAGPLLRAADDGPPRCIGVEEGIGRVDRAARLRIGDNTGQTPVWVAATLAMVGRICRQSWRTSRRQCYRDICLSRRRRVAGLWDAGRQRNAEDGARWEGSMGPRTILEMSTFLCRVRLKQ
jgi:hypothetical protein